MQIFVLIICTADSCTVFFDGIERQRIP